MISIKTFKRIALVFASLLCIQTSAFATSSSNTGINYYFYIQNSPASQYTILAVNYSVYVGGSTIKSTELTTPLAPGVKSHKIDVIPDVLAQVFTKIDSITFEDKSDNTYYYKFADCSGDIDTAGIVYMLQPTLEDGKPFAYCMPLYS